MATYAELRGEFNNADLRNRVTTAVVVAAHTLLVGATPTADERAWATAVISQPNAEGQKALLLVLAANKDANISTIQGATDTAIQTNVDNVVDQLVAANAGV